MRRTCLSAELEHRPPNGRTVLNTRPQVQPSILAAVRADPIAIALLMIVLAILSTPGAAFAQPAGTLAGSLFDQTGGALANVTLDVRGPVIRDRQSDDTGRFEFRDLPPGDYELRAALVGFETIHRAIRIQAETTLSLSLTMIVASLEQTVVTAVKTGTTNVQSSPLAISAISSTALSRFAIRTIDEAAAQTPSVTFTQNTTFGQLSIRGIGTNAVFAGADPSSAMYLDGVYLARPAMAFTDFLDVERIEVVRGPQGTLYGRNALGGAVNLITKAPSNDFEALARVTIGNLAERRAEARLGGALKRDRVMGSLAFTRGVRDGYVRDLNHPDQPLGGDDFTSARGQLRVVLSPRSDVVLSTDVSDQAGRILSNHKILSIKPGFSVDNPVEPRDVRLSMVNSSGVRHSGATARVTFQVTPSTTLVSITGFRRLNNQYVSDADVSELDLLVSRIGEWQHQWSEELTVSGRNRTFTWVAGFFVFDEFDHQGVWVDQNASRTQVQLEPRVSAKSRAVFGETTIQLIPRLSGTVGLRYTREQKGIENTGGLYSLDAPMSPVAGSTYAYADSIMHSAWTPRFAISMKLPHDAMTYVSATRGFKSGGFNPSSMQPGRGFAPEWAWNYEAGVKTTLMNGRARINVAAFQMDYTNLQVQTPIGVGVFDIRNAAEATIRGVEVESSSRVGGGVEGGGHLAWLAATYDRYSAVGIGGVTGDVAGNRLNNAPEWSGRLWLEWTGNVGRSTRVTLTADANAQSTVFYTPFNDTIQCQFPYGLLGARGEFGPSNRRWAVNVYARNISNTDYITGAFGASPVAFGGRPGQSREIGIQLIMGR
jgi:iron complex outermembrane recepter protein